MATQLAIVPSIEDAQHYRESQRSAKSLLETGLEFLKFLTVLVTLGATLLVGPIVTVLAFTYVAYLLNRLFGG